MKKLLVLLEDQLHARGINLHILTGICAGIDRPDGAAIAGKMLFMVAVMAAEMARDLIRERTLDGLRAAQARAGVAAALPLSMKTSWRRPRPAVPRRNRRSKVTRKGSAVDIIVWQTGTARLLPRLLDGRTRGPVSLTGRRARVALAAADLDPGTGRARLSYRRAEEIFTELTKPLAHPDITDPAQLADAPGWTLHDLRHSALTHAENGANTGTLLAYSGHSSVASLARYTRVSPDTLHPLASPPRPPPPGADRPWALGLRERLIRRLMVAPLPIGGVHGVSVNGYVNEATRDGPDGGDVRFLTLTSPRGSRCPSRSDIAASPPLAGKSPSLDAQLAAVALMAGAASRAAWHTPQRMVRAGGSTKTMRLISMVRVSQRAVTWAWSGQTAAPQSAQMATASVGWPSDAVRQSKQFTGRPPGRGRSGGGPTARRRPARP